MNSFIKRIAENCFLMAILAALFLSLAFIFFFSQHHSCYQGCARNEADGYWYAQMKGYPVTYAGFSIENQQVPTHFLKIKNVHWPWVEKDNNGAKVYVYFDLKLVLPFFLTILAIVGGVLVILNYLFYKKYLTTLLFFDYILLILSFVAMIFFYNFSVSWN